MKTYTVRAGDISRKWIVVDANGQTLGRLASEIAQLLRGKGKPIFEPHMDVGDYVIVVNAAKVRVTGKKTTQKIYYRHTMYPSGLRAVPFNKVMAAHPTRILEKAVRGMLPKGPLGNAIYKKLKVYAGPTHPHEAQVKGSMAVEQEASK